MYNSIYTNYIMLFSDPMILQGSTFFLSELSVVEEKCIPKKGSQSEWCGCPMSRQILSVNENLPFFNIKIPSWI